MSDRMIKRLILWIPTITIGLWEYIRHTVLLPYMSMDLGNILAPIIVFAVSAIFLTKLFALLEETQRKLRQEQQLKAELEERERLAQELHDGISQSLFMLSVKINRLEHAEGEERQIQFDKLKQTVHHVHDDVRQAIANLQAAPQEADFSWTHTFMQMIEEMRVDTEWEPEVDWRLDDEQMTIKEKITLFSCVREALTNVRKHAQAKHVTVLSEGGNEQFYCEVRDDGAGMKDDPFSLPGKYGMKMMRDRIHNMGWQMSVYRQHEETVICIRKGKEMSWNEHEAARPAISHINCG
ncbi:sensor histidine kinase [Paenibacillus taiwanensis]|uniref:sensor histidine kinase n=1 Tax=Paenibacillus taiwanensis TaxID=401638 RepID=UPI0003F9E9E5|nr:histidine kinase [Paenibacillus taiwanensis]